MNVHVVAIIQRYPERIRLRYTWSALQKDKVRSGVWLCGVNWSVRTQRTAISGGLQVAPRTK